MKKHDHMDGLQKVFEHSFIPGPNIIKISKVNIGPTPFSLNSGIQYEAGTAGLLHTTIK